MDVSFDAWARKLSAPAKGRKGYAVVLGDDEHVLAPYAFSGDKPVIGMTSRTDSPSLKELSSKAKGLSLCFSPRSLYADVGDFSSVSPEATYAHIRSTVDKIGLFKDGYCIAYRKIREVDNLKSKYSFLAVSAAEMNKTELLDEKEALVDMYCPIEVSIAAAVGLSDKNMAVIVYQDLRFIRIIGAKEGVIYYLITINSAESFDAEADTVSGIREMTSMLMNTYQERVQKVYTIGRGDISLSDLDEYDIRTEPYHPDESPEADASTIVLLGTALHPEYNFTPEKLKKTKKIVEYAKYSLAVSLALILLSAVFFLLGWNNARQADDYKRKANAAIHKNALELKTLEEDYTSLSKNLDLTKVNQIIGVYKDYEAEPRFNAIVDAVAAKVPENVFITRIDVTRPSGQDSAAEAGGDAAATPSARATRVGSFSILIEGVVNAPYPQSKGIFSSFTEAVQELYSVKNASFSHKELNAEFALNCEMKL